MADFPIAKAENISVKMSGVEQNLEETLNSMTGGFTVEELPPADAEHNGKVYQYVGATTDTYTKGYFYLCTTDESANFVWVQTDVQTPSVVINDSGVSSDSTWSSKKISDFGEALDKKVEDVDTKVGDLEELKTTEKDSVVGAVNEISDSLVDLESELGEKVNKSYVVDKLDRINISMEILSNTIAPNGSGKIKFDNWRTGIFGLRYTMNGYFNIIYFVFLTDDRTLQINKLGGIENYKDAISLTTNGLDLVINNHSTYSITGMTIKRYFV